MNLFLKNPKTDVNILDSNGYTPLHHAVFCNNPAAVILLLKDVRTDVTIRDKSGFTAYELAKKRHFGAILEIFSKMICYE